LLPCPTWFLLLLAASATALATGLGAVPVFFLGAAVMLALSFA
jgi:hypothetical protein